MYESEAVSRSQMKREQQSDGINTTTTEGKLDSNANNIMQLLHIRNSSNTDSTGITAGKPWIWYSITALTHIWTKYDVIACVAYV
mgnify:CR=1 FL=1